MGTNYYKILTEAEILARKQKLIDDINNLDLSVSSIEDGFRVEVEGSWERTSCWDNFVEGVSIHLGKRSSGWKFCWNFHKDKYYSTKEELLAFIRSGRIVDEYGHEVNVEEFIEMALSWGEPDGLVFDEDYENNKSGSSYFHGPKYWDRVIDGLRVSSSTEFS
jgi:hypothetical protein